MKPTKIEKIETILWDRWLLVRIYCEDGTVGIGEAASLSRQTIDVRSRDLGLGVVATNIAIAEIIGHEKDDVGTLRHLGQLHRHETDESDGGE